MSQNEELKLENQAQKEKEEENETQASEVKNDEIKPEITEESEVKMVEAEEIKNAAKEDPVEEVKVVEIYTDGACSGNPGPGGYAAIVLHSGTVEEIKGGEKLTTNNKMELMGAIEGLRFVKNLGARIKVYTDSLYVQKGITEWIYNWKKKHFKDVKNVDLWKELDALSESLSIEWHWIKAHAGNKYNEIADKLAKKAVDENR